MVSKNRGRYSSLLCLYSADTTPQSQKGLPAAARQLLREPVQQEAMASATLGLLQKAVLWQPLNASVQQSLTLTQAWMKGLIQAVTTAVKELADQHPHHQTRQALRKHEPGSHAGSH